MMTTRWRPVLALAAAVTVAACIDADHRLTVQPDGQASFEIAIAIEAGLAALAFDGEDDPCRQVVSRPPPDGLSVTSRAASEGRDIICTVTVSGHVDVLAAQLDRLSAAP
jgi:hypothetical protein